MIYVSYDNVGSAPTGFQLDLGDGCHLRGNIFKAKPAYFLPDMIGASQLEVLEYLRENLSYCAVVSDGKGGLTLQRPDDVTAQSLKDAEALSAAKADQAIRLNAECEKQIVAGFVSSALGSDHKYQSDRDDQANMLGSVSTGKDMPFKCQNMATQEWAYRMHTTVQLKQALNDGSDYKLLLLQHCQNLKNQVTTATTVAEVEAIVWTAP